MGEVFSEWRMAIPAPILKRDQKDYMGSYKMVSLCFMRKSQCKSSQSTFLGT